MQYRNQYFLKSKLSFRRRKLKNRMKREEKQYSRKTGTALVVMRLKVSNLEKVILGVGKFMSGTILLTEPEQAVRESICTVFTDEGYQCMCASNGESAIAALNDYQFDLVITEVDLPSISGADVVAKAVNAPSHPSVILITTYPHIDDAYDAMKRGASSFHLKPLDFASLLRSMDKLLASRHIADSAMPEKH
jgi:CheY-like chemotaxis protein